MYILACRIEVMNCSATKTMTNLRNDDSNHRFSISIFHANGSLLFSFPQFVAQPNCQQLLASRWYDEFPSWRRRHWAGKIITCVFIGLLFPLICILYLISPKSRYGLFIRKPFVKFICHTASYLTFLFLLFLASQHIASAPPNCQGPAPTAVEWMILPWVLGNIDHTLTLCTFFI